MELAFETVTLRRLCESDSEARKRYPETVVDDLQARLADLRAATTAADLVVANPIIDARPPGHIFFRLDGDHELRCVVNHPIPPIAESGLIAFERVRRIRIIYIGSEVTT